MLDLELSEELLFCVATSSRGHWQEKESGSERIYLRYISVFNTEHQPTTSIRCHRHTPHMQQQQAAASSSGGGGVRGKQQQQQQQQQQSTPLHHHQACAHTEKTD